MHIDGCCPIAMRDQRKRAAQAVAAGEKMSLLWDAQLARWSAPRLARLLGLHLLGALARGLVSW